MTSKREEEETRLIIEEENLDNGVGGFDWDNWWWKQATMLALYHSFSVPIIIIIVQSLFVFPLPSIQGSFNAIGNSLLVALYTTALMILLKKNEEDFKRTFIKISVVLHMLLLSMTIVSFVFWSASGSKYEVAYYTGFTYGLAILWNLLFYFFCVVAALRIQYKKPQ